MNMPSAPMRHHPRRCDAPIGQWCNGSLLVNASDLGMRSSMISGPRVLPGGLPRISPRDRRLSQGQVEVGGCCCETCASLCGDTYDCITCRGAGTPHCAACYSDAKRLFECDGSCVSPRLPPQPRQPPSPAAPPITSPSSPAAPSRVNAPPSPPQHPVKDSKDGAGLTWLHALEASFNPPTPGTVLLLVCLVSAVLCASCLCLRFLCLRRRRQVNAVSTQQAARSSTPSSGAELDSAAARQWLIAADLEQLPTRLVEAAELESTDAMRECIICLEQLAVGHEMLKLPCEHEYHAACIHRWLTSRASAACPLCKDASWREAAARSATLRS